MLTPETERLRQAWQRAEAVGARSPAIAALEVFVDALLTEPAPIWKAWSRALAEHVVDGGDRTPVRMPLFQRALLPALVEGVLAREAGCARWLAHFEPLLRKCADALPPSLQSPEALLREAVELDPNDAAARRALLERGIRYLKYTLHELPHGVLFGADSASEAQCDELLEYLDELRQDAARLGQAEAHASLFAACALHFRRYGEYLRSGRSAGSYAAFLRAQESDVSGRD